MGFTYIEAYNVPVWIRHWMIKRLNDEIKRANGKQSTHAAHQNTADARSMMGRHRSQVPANLRRFT